MSRFVGLIFALAFIVAGCGDENPELSQAEEEIAELLETPEGREQLTAVLSNGSPLTFEQSTCFIDNTEADELAAVLTLGAGESSNINEVLEPVRQAFELCGVRLDAFNVQ